MNELVLFGAAFVVVFALGFQSLNVNRGHVFAAAIGSIVIGVCNLTIYKLTPQAVEFTEMAAYILGGPAGIVCAMWVHRRFVKRTQAKIERAK